MENAPKQAHSVRLMLRDDVLKSVLDTAFEPLLLVGVLPVPALFRPDVSGFERIAFDGPIPCYLPMLGTDRDG